MDKIKQNRVEFFASQGVVTDEASYDSIFSDKANTENVYETLNEKNPESLGMDKDGFVNKFYDGNLAPKEAPEEEPSEIEKAGQNARTNQGGVVPFYDNTEPKDDTEELRAKYETNKESWGSQAKTYQEEATRLNKAVEEAPKIRNVTTGGTGGVSRPFVFPSQFKAQAKEKGESKPKLLGDEDLAATNYAKAAEILNAPSRFDNSTWHGNLASGAANVLTDKDFWTLGMTEIARNIRQREAVKKFSDFVGSEGNNISAEKVEDFINTEFSENDKMVLSSYLALEDARTARRDDLSYGYQGGQGIVHTLGFMGEMALGGGLTKLATKGLKAGIRKGLEMSPRVLNASKKATAAYGKAKKLIPLSERVKKGSFVDKSIRVGKEIIKDGTVITPFMPSTYNEITREAMDKDLLSAILRGGTTALIQNITEHSGRAVSGTRRHILKNPKVAKQAEKYFSNLAAGKKTDPSALDKVLKASKWDGTFEQFTEEFLNSAGIAARGVVTGNEEDKQSVQDFFTEENMAIMTPSLVFPSAVKTIAKSRPSASKLAVTMQLYKQRKAIRKQIKQDPAYKSLQDAVSLTAEVYGIKEKDVFEAYLNQAVLGSLKNTDIQSFSILSEANKEVIEKEQQVVSALESIGRKVLSDRRTSEESGLNDILEIANKDTQTVMEVELEDGTVGHVVNGRFVRNGQDEEGFEKIKDKGHSDMLFIKRNADGKIIPISPTKHRFRVLNEATVEDKYRGVEKQKQTKQAVEEKFNEDGEAIEIILGEDSPVIPAILNKTDEGYTVTTKNEAGEDVVTAVDAETLLEFAEKRNVSTPNFRSGDVIEMEDGTEGAISVSENGDISFTVGEKVVTGTPRDIALEIEKGTMKFKPRSELARVSDNLPKTKTGEVDTKAFNAKQTEAYFTAKYGEKQGKIALNAYLNQLRKETLALAKKEDLTPTQLEQSFKNQEELERYGIYVTKEAEAEAKAKAEAEAKAKAESEAVKEKTPDEMSLAELYETTKAMTTEADAMEVVQAAIKKEGADLEAEGKKMKAGKMSRAKTVEHIVKKQKFAKAIEEVTGMFPQGQKKSTELDGKKEEGAETEVTGEAEVEEESLESKQAKQKEIKELGASLEDLKKKLARARKPENKTKIQQSITTIKNKMAYALAVAKNKVLGTFSETSKEYITARQMFGGSTDVVEVKNSALLPLSVTKRAKEKGIDLSKASAVIDGGKTYLIADNIANEAISGQQIWMHEEGIHNAISNLYDSSVEADVKARDTMLSSIWRAFNTKTSAQRRTIIEQIEKEYPDATEAQKGEELLAYSSESLSVQSIIEKNKTLQKASAKEFETYLDKVLGGTNKISDVGSIAEVIISASSHKKMKEVLTEANDLKARLQILEATKFETEEEREAAKKAFEDQMISTYQRALLETKKAKSRLYRFLVDDAIDLQHLQTFIQASGGKVDYDAYKDLFRARGRIGTKNGEYDNTLFKDMMDNSSTLVKESGTSLNLVNKLTGEPLTGVETLNMYMRAKDIEDAKATQGEDYKERGETGLQERTGMTAAEIVEAYEGTVNSESMADFWRSVKKNTDFILNVSADGNFITEEVSELLSNRRDYYVPQMDFQERIDKQNEGLYVKNNFNRGKSTSVVSTSTGRTSLSADPLTVIRSNAHKATELTEYNKTRLHFMNLAIDNDKLGRDSKSFYLMTPQEYKQLKDQSNDDHITNVVKVRTIEENEDGESSAVVRYVYVADNDIVKVLNNEIRNPSNSGVMRVSRKVTGLLARILTRYNLIFAASNFVRDYGMGLASTIVEDGVGTAFHYSKNTASNLREIYHHARTKEFKDTDNGKLLKEFYDSGAATGWTMLSDLNRESKKIQELLEPTTTGKMKNAVEVGLNQISAITEASEIATRFGIYKALRDKGSSIEEAATKAKELTLNFDRRGRQSAISAMYMFFNAQMQGMNKLLKGVSSPEHRKGWMAMMTAQVVGGFANSMLTPNDPDDDYYLTDYERAQNLIIGRLKIPRSQGLRAFWAMGVMLGEYTKGRKSGKEAIIDGTKFAASEFVPSMFNPIIGLEHDASTGKMDYDVKTQMANMAPTAITPLVQSAFDRNFLGHTVTTSKYNKKQDDMYPNTLRGKKSTSEIVKRITDFAARLNGWRGEETNINIPYMLDLDPNIIAHNIKGYTGGLGTSFGELADVAYKVYNDDEFQTKDLPGIRNFVVKSSVEDAYNKEYYRTKNRIARHLADAEVFKEDLKSDLQEGIVTFMEETGEYRAKIDRLVEEGKEEEAMSLEQPQLGEGIASELKDVDYNIKNMLEHLMAATAEYSAFKTIEAIHNQEYKTGIDMKSNDYKTYIKTLMELNDKANKR